MSLWTDAILTTKGLNLQAKLLSSGEPFEITKVTGGSGKVEVDQLPEQTAVSQKKQTLTIQKVSYSEDKKSAVMSVLLSNIGLATGYSLAQVGIYANDPDEGEILYAIMQANDDGETIPAASEKTYSVQFDITLHFDNAATVNVTIDPAGLVTFDAISDLMGVEVVPYGTTKPIEDRRENTFYFMITKSSTIVISDNLAIKEAGE